VVKLPHPKGGPLRLTPSTQPDAPVTLSKPWCAASPRTMSATKAGIAHGDCCTSALYGSGKPLFQDRDTGLTWVELRGLEPLTPDR
jgi:hypothetical protein